MRRMAWESVADYVRSLGLDAWMVGGAVRDGLLGKPIRDTDFVVPGVGHAELRAALEPHGLALIQMVTPVTRPERMQRLCAATQGFVYAVTMTGTTGRNAAVPQDVTRYLDAVQAAAKLPVCAGFGIRSREQVEQLRGHVAGVIVGSALVEMMESGQDAGSFLKSLRPAGT
jgi:tryptophan synthase alpha chain